MFAYSVSSTDPIPYTQTAVVMLTLLVSPSAPYDVAVEHVAVAYAISSQFISTVKYKNKKGFRSNLIPVWEHIFMSVLYNIVSSLLSRARRNLSRAP
jgi:phosphatidylserine synthase